MIRTVKERHPENYMRRMEETNSALIEERNLLKKDLPFEFMLNALRLVEGVPSEYFSQRTGLPISSVSNKLNIATSKGLLDPNPSLIKASSLGLQYLNDLQEIFL